MSRCYSRQCAFRSIILSCNQCRCNSKCKLFALPMMVVLGRGTRPLPLASLALGPDARLRTYGCGTLTGVSIAGARCSMRKPELYRGFLCENKRITLCCIHFVSEDFSLIGVKRQKQSKCGKLRAIRKSKLHITASCSMTLGDRGRFCQGRCRDVVGWYRRRFGRTGHVLEQRESSAKVGIGFETGKHITAL